ncbi:glycosyltransferase family 2 protein [Vreelandella rituensis]|uniref:Glycosyltransferase n=1 Tax=Vreelandella rituensis TaxID=2282306 RepID=A0A368TM85_9GAMM|nr:glycosyltransferase family 2 protein [Halomonas rituensis]RCV85765.1 glycosyltransferase [Halomonas rituensis]
MGKVIAVVLTYNRQDLLQQCLDAIYSQTYSCDQVVVIDNASDDGTQKMLSGLNYPNLKVYLLSYNVGAAGGFNAGFRIAYQEGADYVWMMDDDVIPEPCALQRLTEADSTLDKNGIDRAYLISTAFTENGYVTNSPSINETKNHIGYKDWPKFVQYGVVAVGRATFVSILIPRGTLEKYGLPISDMFIWGEDTEYTLRITKDVPGFVVGASRVMHLRQEKGVLNIASESSEARLKYYRYLIRNRIFVTRKYRPIRMLLMIMYLDLYMILKLLRKGRLKKASIVTIGLVEGFLFSPAVEYMDSPVESQYVPLGIYKCVARE